MSSSELDQAERLLRQLLEVQEDSGKGLLLPIQGWSMGPIVGPAARVEVVPLRGRPRFGDVVWIRGAKGHMVHRVIGRTGAGGRWIVTKGDNCYKADPPVPADEVLGLAIGVWRDERCLRPMHWHRPFSLFYGILSWIESRGWPGLSYSIRRLRIFYMRRRYPAIS